MDKANKTKCEPSTLLPVAQAFCQVSRSRPAGDGHYSQTLFTLPQGNSSTAKSLKNPCMNKMQLTRSLVELSKRKSQLAKERSLVHNHRAASVKFLNPRLLLSCALPKLNPVICVKSESSFAENDKMINYRFASKYEQKLSAPSRDSTKEISRILLNSSLPAEDRYQRYMLGLGAFKSAQDFSGINSEIVQIGGFRLIVGHSASLMSASNLTIKKL